MSSRLASLAFALTTLLAAGAARADDAWLLERPETLPYVEGRNIPAGYELRSGNLSKGLIGSGITVAGAGYVISLLTGIVNATSHTCKESCPGLALTMSIPVGGPFGAFALKSQESVAPLYFAWGVVQLAGIGLVITGVSIDDDRLVRTRDRLTAPPVSLRLAPIVGPGFSGIGVVGSL